MIMNSKDCAFIVIDVQEKLLPNIYEHEKVLARCTWLNNFSNDLKIPTIICEQYSKGLGLTPPQIRDNIPDATIIDKIYFSAAKDIMFVDKLASMNKSSVVLCGIEAHVCVLQTALDLVEMDYSVYVVSDAIGSRSEYDKNVALTRMQHNKVNIVTSEMVYFEWLEKAGSQEFKDLSNKYLKG